MFEREPRVTPLESRKRLLIAESEVNRVRLLEDWRTLAGGISSFASQYGPVSRVMNSSTGSLVANLATLMSNWFKPEASKSSWLGKIFSGARLASSIWLLLRARSAAKKEHANGGPDTA